MDYKSCEGGFSFSFNSTLNRKSSIQKSAQNLPFIRIRKEFKVILVFLAIYPRVEVLL